MREVMTVTKYIRASKKYFEKHADFNALTHVLLGVGFGAVLTYPVFGSHPVRYGLIFLVIGIGCHIWAATRKS